MEMRTPERLELAQGVDGRLRVLHGVALGDLQVEGARGQARLAQRALDVLDEVRLLELARGEVHGHATGADGPPPATACACAQAVRSIQTPMGRMRPVTSARWMNSPG